MFSQVCPFTPGRVGYPGRRYLPWPGPDKGGGESTLVREGKTGGTYSGRGGTYLSQVQTGGTPM